MTPDGPNISDPASVGEKLLFFRSRSPGLSLSAVADMVLPAIPSVPSGSTADATVNEYHADLVARAEDGDKYARLMLDGEVNDEP